MKSVRRLQTPDLSASGARAGRTVRVLGRLFGGVVEVERVRPRKRVVHLPPPQPRCLPRLELGRGDAPSRTFSALVRISPLNLGSSPAENDLSSERSGPRSNPDSEGGMLRVAFRRASVAQALLITWQTEMSGREGEERGRRYLVSEPGPLWAVFGRAGLASFLASVRCHPLEQESVSIVNASTLGRDELGKGREEGQGRT